MIISNKTPTLSSFAKLFGFSETEMSLLAEEYQLQQRNRKIKWWQLLFINIITLYSKGTKHKDRVAAMLLYFGTKVCENAFSDRLSQLSTEFLERIIHRLNEYIKLIGSPKKRAKLQELINILAEDASLITLDVRSENDFDKYQCNPKAQAKLFILIDVFTNGCLANTVEECKASEKKVIQQSELYNNQKTIELRDRGWFSHKIFKKLINERRYFITRVRKDFNPLIKSVTIGDQGWIGKKLSDIDLSKWNEINIEVYLLDRKRKKVFLKDKEYLSLCVKGKRLKNDFKYYAYYLADEWEFSFNDLWYLYRYRWYVEEVFKILKSRLGLSKLRLRNKYAIINMIKIIIITFLISNICVKQMAHAYGCSEKGFSLFRILEGEIGYHFREIVNHLFCTDKPIRKCDWKILTESLYILTRDKKISLSHRNRKIINLLSM